MKRKLIVVFFLFVVLLGVYAGWVEPRRLVVVHRKVALPGLKVPVRALLVGDLQPAWPWWDGARLGEAMDRGAALNPDIVFFVGDYAYEHGTLSRLGLFQPFFVPPADTVAAMARIQAPMGVFAVMGNHDWWWDGPEVLRLVGKTHIRMLLDEAVWVERGDQGLWVVGLEDIATPRRSRPDLVLARTDPRGPRVVLTHSPDAFPDLPSSAELTLAGHTHGGQVWLPLLGRPVVPIRHKEFAYGQFVRGSKHLIVTAGVGLSILPVRFLTPPELVLLELVPETARLPDPPPRQTEG